MIDIEKIDRQREFANQQRLAKKSDEDVAVSNLVDSFFEENEKENILTLSIEAENDEYIKLKNLLNSEIFLSEPNEKNYYIPLGIRIDLINQLSCGKITLENVIHEFYKHSQVYRQKLKDKCNESAKRCNYIIIGEENNGK